MDLHEEAAEEHDLVGKIRSRLVEAPRQGVALQAGLQRVAGLVRLRHDDVGFDMRVLPRVEVGLTHEDDAHLLQRQGARERDLRLLHAVGVGELLPSSVPPQSAITRL
uniref:Uncharacterized protein n=1 Tax=Tetraselmis sp. GSL018 TaxID=582737 RepID=A0A061SDV0_9CHLO